MMNPTITYEQLQEARDYLLPLLRTKPQIAIILGSSLGSLADNIEQAVHIPYKEVPHMLLSTAPGHKGEFVCGRLAGKEVIAMSGRFHYYEGYSFEELAIPVRILKLLGVEYLILTNAAGCVNTAWQVGDVMVITDHINLMGASPLRGKNWEALGERFFDISDLYAADLQKLALEAASELGQEERTHSGVYFFMPGPHYESPAEIKAIRILGGDAVGMSTVTEALTAAHAGIPVLGLSLMTNMAAGITDEKLSDAGVAQAAAESAQRLQALLQKTIEKIG